MRTLDAVRGLSIVMLCLVTQGCCLFFECPCNYQHKIYNRSGETVACRIVSANHDRKVLLRPNEMIKVDFCTELFVIQYEDKDAAFVEILGNGLFCPLEITPAKELFVTETRFQQYVKGSLVKPVYLPKDKRLYWSDLIREITGVRRWCD